MPLHKVAGLGRRDTRRSSRPWARSRSSLRQLNPALVLRSQWALMPREGVSGSAQNTQGLTGVGPVESATILVRSGPMR